jgi:hypothetical protein
MNVPDHLVPQLIEFIRLRFGGDLRLHDDSIVNKSGEYARGFIGDDFVMIRKEHESDDVTIASLVCSNVDKRQKVETQWEQFCLEAMRDAENFDE